MALGDSFTFFLLLFLSFFCFLCTSTTATHARPHRHRVVVVDIQNDLPNTTQEEVQNILELRCDPDPFSYLKPGDNYNRTLQVVDDDDEDRTSLECIAEWSRWFTTWDAYEANRDKAHHTVRWSVRKDGFYHSWDGSKWKLLEDWYTE